ncbi:MAG TPA: hypothetical protein VMY87_03545 [Armatimonadota bacterium]|nr:hypothetical protein [Armatimonadota bacterium]
MKRRFWTTYLALALLMGSCIPVFAQGSRGTAPPPSSLVTEWKPKPVTLDLKSVPLNEAIEQIVAATDLPVLRVGDIPAEPRVTMVLRESNPIEVLQLLSGAGDLRFDVSQHYVSDPAVALIAVMNRSSLGPGGRFVSRKTVSESAPAQTIPVEIHLAIDLNVEDAPFREAVAQITAQIPDTEQVQIVVDDSVPDDIRVTARVHKMRLSWVLDNLVSQADLSYGLQDQVDPKVAESWRLRYEEGLTDSASLSRALARAPRLRTIHIVPKPELKVSAGGQR